MKPLVVLGIILILVGALALGYQGFSYVTRDKVVDAGPIQVSAEREKFVYVPPIVGGVAVLAGLTMLLLGAGRGSAGG